MINFNSDVGVNINKNNKSININNLCVKMNKYSKSDKINTS